MVTTILLVIITLLLSAIFSGIEIAFISANRLAIELKNQAGRRRGIILSKLFERPSDVISTLLIGNNITLVIFGLMMAKLLGDWVFPDLNIEGWRFNFLNLFITTMVILIFGEFLPKVLFQMKASNMLLFFTYPLVFIKHLFFPIRWVMVNSAKFCMKEVFKMPITDEQGLMTRMDLIDFIDSVNTGQEEEINKDYFGNALKLTDLKVRECMIPRTEIKGVDINDSSEKLIETFKLTRLSKLIIYRESFDDILGYVHHQKLFGNQSEIKDLLMDIPIVPESMLVNNLMNLMSKRRVSIACVVDEYGGTSGIVTHEDIIEEIVGEIEDEHDSEDLINTVLEDGTYILSGRVEIDLLNEMYEDFDIPEGDYQSLSGYILHEIERIPEKGDAVLIGNMEVTFEMVSTSRIGTVKVKVLDIEED